MSFHASQVGSEQERFKGKYGHYWGFHASQVGSESGYIHTSLKQPSLVSMPHRQDRSIKAFSTARTKQMFPCLIGRIGVSKIASNSKSFGKKVSMPHRQDRSVLYLSSSLLCLLVSMPHRQDRSKHEHHHILHCIFVSMPHRQDRSLCLLFFLFDLTSVSMPHRQDRSAYQDLEDNNMLTGFPCLIGRIGVGMSMNLPGSRKLCFHASQVGSESFTATGAASPDDWFPCLIGRIGVNNLGIKVLDYKMFPCLIGRIGVYTPNAH